MLQSRLLLLIGLLLAAPVSSLDSPAKSGGGSSPAKSGGGGPYSAIAKMVPANKRSSFFKLMKEMRASKSSTVSDALKNATRRSQNGEMQKLLGDELYQKYRQVRVSNTGKLGAKAVGAAAAKSAGAPPVAAKSKGKGKGPGKGKGKGKGSGAPAAAGAA